MFWIENILSSLVKKCYGESISFFVGNRFVKKNKKYKGIVIVEFERGMYNLVFVY